MTRRPGVHESRPSHHQDPTSFGPHPDHRLGDLSNEQTLGLLGRHRARHELKWLARHAPLHGHDLHPGMVDHDQVAFFHPVHGNGFRTAALRVYPDGAVHLGMLHLDPLFVEANQSREIRRGVKMVGKNSVGGCRLKSNGFRFCLERQGAVLFDFSQDFFEQFLSGRVDLNPRRATVGTAMADVNIEDLKLGAEIDNEIEDLGKDQRVDNVTGNLNDAPCHTNLSA